MSIKNYKVAAALAIFCTLLWGTAFPFIKVGYAQFGIEGNDIGSKLLFAGARFTLAGIMVLFIFLVKNKHLPKIEKNGIMPVMLLGSVQTFGQYIFYIYRHRIYKWCQHLGYNRLCNFFYRAFCSAVF